MGMIAVFIIAAVLSASMGMQVTVQEHSYEVVRGGNITLGCKFVPAVQITASTLVVITWSILPDNPELDTSLVATYYSNNDQLDVLPDYEGRISMKPDINTGQANLILSGVTMQENHMFECSVQIPKDTKGQLSDKTRLIVLVPPSKPVCKIQGTPEYFQNISLTCMSEEGSPVPTYAWKSYDVKNSERNLPAKSTDIKGVLSLFNISLDTSGYYICNSVNKKGSASCNVTLTVMPPSMNIGSTAIVIGACAAGLLVLVGIICCCCRHRRKKNKYDKGDPNDMEFHDRDDDDDDDNKEEYRDDKEKYGEQLEKKIDGVGVHEEHGEKTRERRDDNDDQRDDYSNRRDKYDDSRDRYNDRRENYDHRDKYDERSDRYNDRRDDYDRRDRYDDRRDDYDRRDRYDDRRDNYDRRDRYDDRRDNYDRRDRYDDRRDDYDRRDRYDDRSDRQYGRHDQYDEVYDDRHDRDDDHKRPPMLPPSKPRKTDDQ
ncbi:glycoprotein A33 (transmembrane), paralog a [Scleropages formosus]|uniref:Ig-like domain-containing protein n=2 Tax=Scleropages formosus TaxID=113540 RepID=A0A8C9REL7_SCLFO|nr:cell surface A33 antigen [Scleropages formosus]